MLCVRATNPQLTRISQTGWCIGRVDLQELVSEARESPPQIDQIYGSFTEGFDAVDLKDAKALLAELA